MAALTSISDNHQNVLNLFLAKLKYQPFHKISSRSVNNFISKPTDEQTNKQTNSTKNITPLTEIIDLLDDNTHFAGYFIIRHWSANKFL